MVSKKKEPIMTGHFESNSKEEAYEDRSLLAQVALRMARELHYRVRIKDYESEWPILYIELPTGQISYHIAKKDLYFKEEPSFLEWDGHDREEKNERIISYIQYKDIPIVTYPRKCDRCGAIYNAKMGNVILGYCSEKCSTKANEASRRKWEK